MDNTQTTAPRRLYRRSTDRVLAGVCGGLAAYFGIDPILVRLAFVLLAFLGGASILAYIVLWIAVPVGDPTGSSPALTDRGAETFAAVLIAIGAIWLLANLHLINWSIGWPLVVIGVGAALLLRR